MIDNEAAAASGSEQLRASVTYAEIIQQPAVWRETADQLLAQSGELREFCAGLLAEPRLRIVLTGAGTSAFAGAVLAPALTQALHRRVEAVASTDIVSAPRSVFAEDVPTLLISFARSGDSPESIAATELASQCLSSVSHLILTCNRSGRLAVDHSGAAGSMVVVLPERSNDRGFAMTSSFTSMLLTCWLIMTDALDDTALTDTLAAAGETVLTDWERLTELAGRGYRRVVYLGSGALAGLARESALKLLELTAGEVVGYFDTALGFRHGPKSVLDEHTLAVVYLSGEPYTRRYDLDILTELVDALGPDHVMVIDALPDGPTQVGTRFGWPGATTCGDAPSAAVLIMAAQLLGLCFSVALGRTPDNPFPAGEVNRVVRGVTIHPLS